jgi:hypothetical protein
MVKDGSAWCNPVQSSATHTTADNPYQIAICLTNATESPGAFNIELNYDGDLNSCPENSGGASGLDGNPDANVGTTSFSTPNLGTGCDCSSGGQLYPTCDYNPDIPSPKTAFISCTCTASATLPVGIGVSAPLAVVTFNARGFEGIDNLSFGTVAVYSYSGLVLRCPDASCTGATDNKTGGTLPTNTPRPPTPTFTATPCVPGVNGCPTSTPTSRAFTKTPTPAPTNTPGGGGPAPTSAPPPPPPPSGGGQPSVTPPATGSGPADNGWMNTLMFVFGGGAALSLAFGGGLYLRRARNR